jgi:hypothetical protein
MKRNLLRLRLIQLQWIMVWITLMFSDVLVYGQVSCNGGTTISAATIAPSTGFTADNYVVNSQLTIVSLSAGGGYRDASTGYRFGTPTATSDRNYKLVFNTPIKTAVLEFGFINNDIVLNSPNPAGEERIANVTAVGAPDAVYTFQDVSAGGMQNIWNAGTRTISASVNSFGANSSSKLQITSPTPFTEITLTHDYITGTNPFGVILEEVCYALACNAGTTAPTLSGSTISNTCPTTTVNLNSLHTGTAPSGTSLVWFTNNAHSGTAYATPTTAVAGTYYAFYFDAVNNCYSPATAAVTVSLDTNCTDTDGDGIVDITDIDDDNDGILDMVEGSCTVNPAPVANGSTIVNGITYTYSTQSGAPVSLITTDGYAQFYSVANNYVQVDFSPSVKDGVFGLTDIDGLGEKCSFAAYDISGNLMPMSDFQILYLGTNDSFIAPISGYTISAVSTTEAITTNLDPGSHVKLRALKPVSKIRVLYTAGTGGAGTGGVIFSACVNKDTDGDGSPDYLDLDTDGDGCSDAFEAGATTDRTTNYQFPTTGVGSNGLANSLETVADNGIVNYTLTYSNAVNSAVKSCCPSVAPTLSGTTISNTCPTTTVNLNSLLTSTAPSGTSLVWFTRTGTVATQSTPTTDRAGTYYAYYYDAANSCYSPASAAVTVTINVCLDTDNDGIEDIVDIDDDNDGILDSQEECKGYKVYIYNRTDPIFATNIPIQITGSTVQNVLINQTAAYNSLSYNGKMWKLLASNVLPDVTGKITVDMLPNASTSSTYVLADAILIVGDLNTYLMDNKGKGFTTTGAWTFQNTLEALKAYNDNEVFATQPYAGKTAKWTFSNVPFCTPDVDGDNIANSLDTDSDGDGCSDAFEGGATSSLVANYTFPAPYGANGLADAKETAVDNGILNYTSTYANATNNTIKTCTDTDGDSVPDLTDLDDDNDGVLDTVEDFCAVAPGSLVVGEFNGTFGNITAAQGRRNLESAVGNYTYLPSGLNALEGQYVVTSNANNLSTYWHPASTNFRGNTDGSITDAFLIVNGSGVQGTFYQQTLNLPITNATLSVTIDAINWTGVGDNPNIAIQVYAADGTTLLGQSQTGLISQTTTWVTGTAAINTGLNKTLIIKLKNISTSIFGNDFAIDNIRFEVTNPVPPIICDTDGDGIKNSLDLDTDGDGCSDAFEAGATTSPVANYTFPAPYGTNGLANAKETLVDNGIINYTSTYNKAINNAINACPICVAGTTAPTLNGTTISNTCPTTTVNLNSLLTSTAPSGARLRWHTVATNPTASDSVANPSLLASAGTYYAYYFDATNICYSPAAAAVTVTINALPDAPTATVSSQPTCSVATASVYLTGLPSTGTWTLTRLNTTTLASVVITSSGSGSTFIYSFVPQGTYTYTVKNNATNCESTASNSITVNAQPTTPTISNVAKGDPTIASCPVLNNGTITVTATGANLEYSKDNGTTWQASNSFTGLIAGSYTIKVRDNVSTCEVAYASNPVVLTAPVCNVAPVITSPTTATTPENVATTTPVYTATATDPNAGQTQTYSLETGGIDNPKFNINTTTGAVTFLVSPDFENPTDAGADNVYNIKVKVCDNGTPQLCAIQDVAITVTDVNECVTLNLKVILEGPYQTATGKMTTILNQRGLLPGQTPVGQFSVPTPLGQPYNTAPWNYAGTESLSNYPATVTDWVLVSVRTDSSAASTIFRKAGLLHNDGSIVFADTCWALNLSQSYYVVVEHRNHLGVMSAQKMPIVTNKISLDFTALNGYVFINPPTTGQKQVGSKWVMLSGESQKASNLTNYDINFQDSQLWRTQSGIFDCYKLGDHNLDADVNFQDNYLWKINNGRYSGVPH